MVNLDVQSETMENSPDIDYSRAVSIWLFIGLIMIFFQILLGGITRLTGSGLSITQWEIVTGTIPPLNNEEWMVELNEYRQTPQYQKINEGMSLKEFKFIYFWEYIHRLWARLMGFVFLFPFLYFLARRRLGKPLILRLIMLILLASLVASFGWIMVASGLIDQPWVNAYKLTLHLSLALITYGYLFWIWFRYTFPELEFRHRHLWKYSWTLLVLVSLQIVLGGIMAGTKAALFYPTWPGMHGDLIPMAITKWEYWKWENIVNYYDSAFAPALVQFLHRNVAYLILIFSLIFVFRCRKLIVPEYLRNLHIVYIGLVFIQVLLGILTLVYSKGSIPLYLGVMHQAMAILVLTVLLAIHFIIKKVSVVATG